jgi:hypothetical protein
MAEHYIENIVIRRDGFKTDDPSFTDDQCDAVFEFEGTLQLKQIIKNVQNATHNRHDYVFVITGIDKIEQRVD